MNLLMLVRAMFATAPRLRPQECALRVRSGESLLVDVREPREWKNGMAERAIPLSFTDLMGPRKEWTPFLARTGNRELLFYCGAGVRAAIAARLLAREGFRTANTGRLADWAAAGWPVVRDGENGSPDPFNPNR